MAKRERETTEYAEMMRRMIVAYGKRVAAADDADLAEMVALRGTLDEAIATAVRGQRASFRASWADIARGLGTTRQAAQQRYGD